MVSAGGGAHSAGESASGRESQTFSKLGVPSGRRVGGKPNKLKNKGSPQVGGGRPTSKNTKKGGPPQVGDWEANSTNSKIKGPLGSASGRENQQTQKLRVPRVGEWGENSKSSKAIGSLLYWSTGHPSRSGRGWEETTKMKNGGRGAPSARKVGMPPN